MFLVMLENTLQDEVKMWSNTYVKYIIIALVAMAIGIGLGFFLIPSKTIIKTEQVLYKGKTVKVETAGKIVTTTEWNSKSDSYEKTEINARKYDLMATLRRDIDSGTTAVGVNFVFEPLNHVLLGCGYERGLKTKSNSILIIAGIRL